jgi:hypothetical protein
LIEGETSMNRAVSQRSLVFGAGALAASLCIPTIALAQDAPPPGDGTTTAPPADGTPPGNYPPPPPRAPAGQQPSYQYPPSQYPPNYPPPYYPPQRVRRARYETYSPDGIYRPISFSLGIGPGLMWGPKFDGHPESDIRGKAALSYNLFRLGFGIAPNLQLILAFEGTGTNSIVPQGDFAGEHSWVTQHNWLLGLQFFFLQHFYVRGAAGLGTISESSASLDTSGGNGIAVAGAVGIELVQSRHAALGLELNGSHTTYDSNEHWTTGGLDMAVSFF